MSIYSADCLAENFYLVTGASSGIGRAVALQLAQCGARVVIAGRDISRLKHTLSLLPGTGHVISACVLQDADRTADWIKSLSSEHGSFTGLFHAAGIEMVRPVRLTKNEQLNELLSTGILTAFGVARAAAQKNVVMDGGTVVFMSSVAGMRGQTGMTAYSAAKAAVDGLVRSLACELAVRKIRVNSIAAGAVITEMHERLTQTLGSEAIEQYELKHLLGFGSPQDVSAAALFLLSEASRWVTGTTMVIDGGYTVR